MNSEDPDIALSTGIPYAVDDEPLDAPVNAGSAADRAAAGDRDENSGEQPRPERDSAPKTPLNADWYEVLQISHNADQETVHRVYRIMAARFHPDNPRTGDLERFLLMRRAHHVLSDPVKRAEYDASYDAGGQRPLEIFELNDLVHGIEGEKNRRLGILSLLYHNRRVGESKPGISVLELEQRMALPREYLNFTLWYLRAKGYVTCEDNSDYSVTPDGVDYVEAHSATNTLVRDLIDAARPAPFAMGECA